MEYIIIGFLVGVILYIFAVLVYHINHHMKEK